MKRPLHVLFVLLIVLATLVVMALGAGYWYARGKAPQRSGTLLIRGLSQPVGVAWDERGVPHIRAQNEPDLYRALGFVQAQDRLFQMEMARRLARGELAEVFGARLLDTDRLFRTLGLRARAEEMVRQMDHQSATWQALTAYLDGINQFQATRPLPIEFELLHIKPRPFTPVDTLSMAGYLAYSFAAALRTEPVLTYVRDKLGPAYLRDFDLDWHPLGVVGPMADTLNGTPLSSADWQGLAHLAALSADALQLAGLPQFEGSNAWAVSGRHTRSGKPLLAGDPHIAFAVPAVWYEAQLSAPGFELYGHHLALTPFALLGHNRQFGWSLTMFQNDDMDLVAERVNPANRNQVWYDGHWVDLQSRQETIAVRGAPSVSITLRRSPHGPIINDAYADTLGQTPVAMWWTFLASDNPVLEAFYRLDRADTLDKARSAASLIHAPGLNVVWASASGDIGWWAAARLVQRPPGVNPAFILDGANGEADKPGYYRFEDNPQEENPARGFIVSANHQPRPRSGVPVPGYYNLPDRVQRLDQLLRQPGMAWDLQNSQTLQLDEQTSYGPRVLHPLIGALARSAENPVELAMVEQLAEWNGRYDANSIAPTVYTQFVYELTRAAMADELGETLFANLLHTRALDLALPRLTADRDSPWWDKRGTPRKESRADIVREAWRATLDHLQDTLGSSPTNWLWRESHTLTQVHPLGRLRPLNLLFNVGPFPAPGGREVPNNLAYPIGPAPWSVTYGPSTRRLIDFADAGRGLDISPVGQSGVLFDAHYADQTADYLAGRYRPMHLDEDDVRRATRSTLTLRPAN